MGKTKIILGLAVLALIASTAWQIAPCELANYEFKDELRDVASLIGAKIGLAAQTDGRGFAGYRNSQGRGPRHCAAARAGSGAEVGHGGESKSVSGGKVSGAHLDAGDLLDCAFLGEQRGLKTGSFRAVTANLEP